MEVSTSAAHTFATFGRTIHCVRHCGKKFTFAKSTNFNTFFPGVLNAISFLFAAKLIVTRVGTELCSFKNGVYFFPTIFTCYFNVWPFFPGLNCIFALPFSPLWGFEPLARFCKLNPSFFKIKSSFLPVSFQVFRAIKHFKVFYFVIALVSIFVMNIHAFWNGAAMVDPHPSLGVNRHIVCPVTILLLPKHFSKVFSFFNHMTSKVRHWHMSILDCLCACQAIGLRLRNQVNYGLL